MGVRIEWARVADLHLIDERDDVTDEHGSQLDAGNVGLAAGGVIIEGTRAALAEKLAALLTQLTDVTDDEDDEDDDEPAVCFHCGMALDWYPGDGWVARRWVATSERDGYDVEVPTCPARREDPESNRHRPITPAERAARERDGSICGAPTPDLFPYVCIKAPEHPHEH